MLKYEVESDLLTDLGSFRTHCLADAAVEPAPRLALVWAMLTEALDFVESRLPALIRTTSADPADLSAVLQRFRSTSDALDDVIDDCIALLVTESDGTNGDST